MRKAGRRRFRADATLRRSRRGANRLISTMRPSARRGFSGEGRSSAGAAAAWQGPLSAAQVDGGGGRRATDGTRVALLPAAMAFHRHAGGWSLAKFADFDVSEFKKRSDDGRWQ
jgi:hypothetical protein